jgi:hypothetical protein
MGKMQWFSYIIRTARFMLWRFRSLTVQHGDETLQGETRIFIGPEVHRDIAWWQHKLGCDGPEEEEDLLKVDKNFIAPIARCIDIAPTHEWHSDASYEYGIGGVCMATGVYWSYALSAEQKSRLVRDKVQKGSWNQLHINELELAGMVVMVHVMTVLCGVRPSVPGETVRLLGDNMSAVCRLEKAGGAKNPRASIMVRWLGALEYYSGWSIHSQHVAGEKNEYADTVSRMCPADAQVWLEEKAPEVPWRYVKLGPWLHRAMTELLLSRFPSQRWETSLNVSTAECFSSLQNIEGRDN